MNKTGTIWSNSKDFFLLRIVTYLENCNIWGKKEKENGPIWQSIQYLGSFNYFIPTNMFEIVNKKGKEKKRVKQVKTLKWMWAEKEENPSLIRNKKGKNVIICKLSSGMDLSLREN